jgi:chemotaxis protein CheD
MNERDLQLFEFFLLPGYIFFNGEPSLLSTVLGSNVAVSLWDQKKKQGGMANFLYPSTKSGQSATSQYGNVAVQHLINMFLEEGTKQKDIKAQIFGGSTSEASECIQIARENILVAKKALVKFRIEVISEDVGGRMGRKVVYNSFKNEAIVYKVNDLRSSDWYPYSLEGDRKR